MKLLLNSCNECVFQVLNLKTIDSKNFSLELSICNQNSLTFYLYIKEQYLISLISHTLFHFNFELPFWQYVRLLIISDWEVVPSIFFRESSICNQELMFIIKGGQGKARHLEKYLLHLLKEADISWDRFDFLNHYNHPSVFSLQARTFYLVFRL